METEPLSLSCQLAHISSRRRVAFRFAHFDHHLIPFGKPLPQFFIP